MEYGQSQFFQIFSLNLENERNTFAFGFIQPMSTRATNIRRHIGHEPFIARVHQVRPRFQSGDPFFNVAMVFARTLRLVQLPLSIRRLTGHWTRFSATGYSCVQIVFRVFLQEFRSQVHFYSTFCGIFVRTVDAVWNSVAFFAVGDAGAVRAFEFFVLVASVVFFELVEVKLGGMR